ncbi:MAG: NAD(P)-dependent oxidoreductase [Bacteroidales bacterium]|nr:NAD(P)-dependent oxidoreductase [Bacteroidales bacterium]
MKKSENKILIVDSVHDFLLKGLEKMGFLCIYSPGITRNEIENKIHDCFGIILRSKTRIDSDLINKARKLKFIARIGSGMENIDVRYAEKKGICCINSPEGNRDAVGEHALGLLLSLLKNINKADKEIKKKIWGRKENKGIEVSGKTIGIIGYGNTGNAFAKRLSGFDAKILAYDKYKKKYSDKYVKETNLNTLFSEADVFSIHLPLTNETHYMVDDNFLKKFKKNIYLINTSRGQIVKTDDLVKNLKTGKIRGAALDVLEYESSTFEKLNNTNNKSFKYLINSDKVILTPHIAGQTDESALKHAKVILGKIKREIHFKR